MGHDKVPTEMPGHDMIWYLLTQYYTAPTSVAS